MTDVIIFKCGMFKTSPLSTRQNRGVTPASISIDQGRRTAPRSEIWARFENSFLGVIWA